MFPSSGEGVGDTYSIRSVNPDETELFINRKKIEGFMESTPLNNATYWWAGEMFVVILDAKLIRWEHVMQRISKVYSSFWLYHRTFGKTWSLKPRIVQWLYIGIVRPMLMYVADVLWSRTDLAIARVDPGHLQRLVSILPNLLIAILHILRPPLPSATSEHTMT